MSGSGFIDFMIMNEDGFASTFYAELTNCTNEVLAAPSQQISIAGYKVFSGSFKVQTTQSEAQNYTCSVNLKNSEGTQIDTKLVGFSTTAQQNYTVDQGDNGAQLPGTEATQEYKESGCDSCSGFFSLICLLSNFCLWQSIVTIVVILIILVVIALSCKYCRWIYKYIF